MAEVAILHAPDKAAAAARLAEAITAAGYAVGAVEVEPPERLAEALGSAAADARILIWSRPLVAHALLTGEVARIRQSRDVVEVSADGIEPPASGGEGRVVLISGWRGQPFHPGWQRIQLDLKRLCGARKGAVEAPRRAAPAASSAAGGRPPARAGLIAGVAAAALLVVAAVGGASWLGRSAPAERPRQQAVEASPTPQALPQPGPEPEPVPAPAPAPSTVPPPPPPPAPRESAPVATAAPPSPPATARSAESAARPSPPRPAVRRPRPDPQGPAKRYSPRNSRVMRQFCARSGRSTPQCRAFLSAVRGSD